MQVRRVKIRGWKRKVEGGGGMRGVEDAGLGRMV